MKSRIILVIVILTAISACKFAQHRAGAAPSISTSVNFPILDSADIFDSVKVADFKPSIAARDYAQKVYLNAIDLYANLKKPNESLPLFLRSLRIAPNPYVYLKCAEASYACGRDQYDLAAGCANMALYDPNVKPQAEMMLARIYVYGSPYAAMEMLERALQDYPFDVKLVAADTAFTMMKDQEEFKVMLTRYNVTDASRKKTVLRMFGTNFVKQALPFGIPNDSLTASNGNNIDYVYADILKDLVDGRRAFSRMVDKEYQYVAEIDLSPAYHTFIYREVNNSYSDSMGSIYYYAATIDTNGINIDRSVMACYCSPLDIQVGTIDTAGILEVRAIKQEWKYNPVDSGYSNNEVTKQQLKGKTYFRFTPEGKIERVDDGYIQATRKDASL